jgi:hypothetical protein
MLEPSRLVLWTNATLGVIAAVEATNPSSRITGCLTILSLLDAHGIRNILPGPRQQVHALASCNAGFVNKPMSKR